MCVLEPFCLPQILRMTGYLCVCMFCMCICVCICMCLLFVCVFMCENPLIFFLSLSKEVVGGRDCFWPHPLCLLSRLDEQSARPVLASPYHPQAFQHRGQSLTPRSR